ncbi:MAG: DUF4442 domain-containing protein [Bdellovibrionales bacterium]|nr:DUF4442 domain-containing protein [Bdellovibrionales bacterium]
MNSPFEVPRSRESLESKLWRIGGNWFPAYRRSGARITFVAADFREVHIHLPSNFTTRNHMGITWGGGLYSAIDPIYGVMLYKILQRKYQVIDKSAHIQFKKPARTDLQGRFKLDDEEIIAIKNELSKQRKVERTYWVELVDELGNIHVKCEKVLVIRRLS